MRILRDLSPGVSLIYMHTQTQTQTQMRTPTHMPHTPALPAWSDSPCHPFPPFLSFSIFLHYLTYTQTYEMTVFGILFLKDCFSLPLDMEILYIYNFYIIFFLLTHSFSHTCEKAARAFLPHFVPEQSFKTLFLQCSCSFGGQSPVVTSIGLSARCRHD